LWGVGNYRRWRRKKKRAASTGETGIALTGRKGTSDTQTRGLKGVGVGGGGTGCLILGTS